MTIQPISPSELLKVIMDDELDPEIVPNVVVGGADNDQQDAGVVSLMDAGTQKPELYTKLLWVRSQIRCLHPDLATVDVIGRHVYDVLQEYGKKRHVVGQPSTGNLYLVNGIYVSTGPSMHKDSQETTEDLLFASVCVHSDPVGTID